MSFARADQEWEQMQARTFTRWVLNRLEGHCEQKINDITKDLSSGVALINLATVLTHKESPREWIHSPKRNAEMIQNCDLALGMFIKDGVCISGISGKDINENNENVILGLIWTLILHYSISRSVSSESIKDNKQNDSSKYKNDIDALMSWAIDRISSYPNVNNNFQPYSLSMCALLDSYVPDRINFYSLNQEDSENNSKLAINVMEDFGIPIFLYPYEINENNNNIDEKTLLTQLSSVKVVLDSLHKNEQIQKVSIGIEYGTDFSIEDEIDEANKSKEIAEAEVDRLKRELSAAESNLKILNEERTKADLKIRLLMQQIEQYKARNYSDDEIEKLKNALKESESKKKYLSDRFAQKNWHNEIEIDHLKEEIIRLNNEIQEMRKTLLIPKEQLSQLEKKKLSETDKLSISESNSHDFNSSNQQYSQDEIEKLYKAYSDAISMCDKLANQFSELKKNYKDEIENLSNEISRLNKELTISEAIKNQLVADLNKKAEKSEPRHQNVESHEINQLKNALTNAQDQIAHEKELRENAEKSASDIKTSYDKLEDELKRYKETTENIIKEILKESNSIKLNDQKQKETIKTQEEKILQQKEDLSKSEKNIILLTSLLKESQKEAKMNKVKLRESECMNKSLSETLHQLDKETKYRYQIDSTEISNALLDAQNEREAKESAQSGVERLSSELKKSVAEATIAKNAKEVAFQNVNELTKQLEIALKEADKNKNIANEAERIAFNLSNQLNDLHQQFVENEKENETKIAKLEKEVDLLRKENEDSKYEVERLSNVLFESEEIAEHQKNQADFEIDRLTGQIRDLQSDVNEFKEANERFALKIQKLSTELIKSQSEARESKNKEIEATRIAQLLSRELKEFDAGNKNHTDTYEKEFNEAISAKEIALIEVDRLKDALNLANAEISHQKNEKEKAQSDIVSLNAQFENLLIEMQKNKMIRIEAERMANDLSKSLDAALSESKAQREEDEMALKEAREIAIKEQNEKEAAKKEVNRLTKELNDTEAIAENEKEQNKKLIYKAEILSNALINSQRQNEAKKYEYNENE